MLEISLLLVIILLVSEGIWIQSRFREKSFFSFPKRFIVGYISDIQVAEVLFFLLLNRLTQSLVISLK